VFPEEFQTFLVPAGALRTDFLAQHQDLLDIYFWQGVQKRIAAGEVVDVFPYRREARLQRNEGRRQ
jgi:isocitrate dehydrogenase kinase/phosphatase